jgi:hypothetical protein
MLRLTSASRTLTAAVVLAAAALLSCASTALAVDDDSWRFSLTPYIWLPSISSSLRVPDIQTDVGNSTEGYDLIGNLDFAFLGSGEIAKGKLGFLFDVQTIKLSNEGKVTVEGVSHNFNSDLTVADATLALEYRMVDAEKFSLDGFGGARIMYGDIGLDIDASGAVAGSSGSDNKTWIDPIAGVKCRYRFNDKWSLGAYGDIGGFVGASTITYQLIGTVRYSFTKNIALDVGYRYFFDKFESGDYKFDASLYGPVLGLTFSF